MGGRLAARFLFRLANLVGRSDFRFRLPALPLFLS